MHPMHPQSPSRGIIGRWTFSGIEAKTGLDFLQKLPMAERALVKAGRRKRSGNDTHP